MTSHFIQHIVASARLALLTRIDDRRFQMLTPPPARLANLLPPAGSITEFDTLPFLQNFLIDADAFWQGSQEERLSSGAWLEDSDDGPVPLEATALRVEGNAVLMIEDLAEKYHNDVAMLQQGRDNLLFNEKLELEVRKRTAMIAEREEQISLKLLAAVGYRDEETGMHVKRIGLYSAVMARTLGWSKTDIDNIRMASPMHDIGKIGIPDSILQKPGRLSESEFDIMKQHPTFGGDMLAGTGIAMMDMASDIARCHHERWDGQGYPAGLKEQAIPVAARIVTIVDVYDALTHKRYYKPAFSEEKTLDILGDMAGSHIDPELFKVFLSVLPELRQINESMPDEEIVDDIEIRR